MAEKKDAGIAIPSDPKQAGAFDTLIRELDEKIFPLHIAVDGEHWGVHAVTRPFSDDVRVSVRTWHAGGEHQNLYIFRRDGGASWQKLYPESEAYVPIDSWRKAVLDIVREVQTAFQHVQAIIPDAQQRLKQLEKALSAST